MTQLHGVQLSAEQMASAMAVPASRADFALKKGGPQSDPDPNFSEWQTVDGTPECAAGYACMRIKAGNGWLDMWYYNYGVYKLQDWIGPGWLNQRQTGGATLRLLNASGGVIGCYESGVLGAVSHPNWTPVYYIQLSPQGC
ncbi:hypothetical protein [Streptomyces sp. NPDC048643]|uniref:hypothetical protein n=1 Tax=Streptomyces sp. NPDC048643 TaxID=3155637 RepID=UPI003417B312